MRKEIVTNIEKKLNAEMGIPVYVYEPEYEEDILKFPLAVILMGKETSDNYLNNRSKRTIPISVLIVVDAALKQKKIMRDKFFKLLDLTDECEDSLINFQFPVGSKNPRVMFESIDWFMDLSGDEKVVFAASVNFNCLTTR